MESVGVPAAKSVFKVSGNSVTVETPREVQYLEAFTPAGTLAASSAVTTIELPCSGIYIIGVRYADGSVERRKISI